MGGHGIEVGSDASGAEGGGGRAPSGGDVHPGLGTDVGPKMRNLADYLRAGYQSAQTPKKKAAPAPSSARASGEEIPQMSTGGEVPGRTVVEQDDHFHVTDHRGSFKVAKAGLDEATHTKIRGMCSGGDVQHLWDGGAAKRPMVDMSHPENLSPEMQKALLAAQLSAQAPTPDMEAAGVAPHQPSPTDRVPGGSGLTYTQVIDANTESSTGREPQKLRPDDPQATLGQGALDRLQGPPKPAPKPLTTLRPVGGPAPAPQDGQQKPMGGGGGGIPGLDPRDLAEAKAGEAQGFQAKQAALADERAASASAAQAQADQLKAKAAGEADLAAQQVQMAADHKKALAAQMTTFQRAVDEYGRTSIDPNRYWADASTGQKVLAGIGLLFGAMGAAHDGVNKSVGIINQAIDRDIDAQKANLAAKGHGVEMRRGILGAMFTQFQDEDAALAATGEAYRKHATTLMEEMATRTQDPVRQAQLRATAAGLLQSRAQERLAMEAGWQAKAAEIAVAKQKVAQGWTKLNAAGKGGGGKQMTAEQQERMAGAQSAYQALETIEREIDKIGPGVSPSALVPGTRAYRFSDKAKAAATVFGKFLEGQRFSDADRKHYESLMPSMSDSAARQKEKIQQGKTLLRNKYGAELQTLGQAGFNTSGFRGQGEPSSAGAPEEDDE